MLGLHLRLPPLLKTWQHVLDLVAGGHVFDLVVVIVVGELDRPDNCRPVVACRGDHRGGGAVSQAQDHAIVTLHHHKCHKIRVMSQNL